jgi:hypothetical protein
LWGKLVFLGGRGGVVPAVALVGLSIVSVASSPSAVAFASSSVASSSPVVGGSSSVIAVAAAHGAIRFSCSSDCRDLNRFSSVIISRFWFPVSVSDSRDTSLCSGSMSIRISRSIQ